MTFAFIFDSVGGTEWLVLLGVILIVVGPKNLPSAARKLGQVMSTLRRAADEFKRQLLSMDEELKKTVDDAVKTDYVETPKSDGDSSAGSSAGDASSADGGEDRAETDYYGYDENNPYPGHEYYDDTQYQGDAGTGSEMGTGDATASAAPSPEPAPETPKKPAGDPYEIKITVTTAGSEKRA